MKIFIHVLGIFILISDLLSSGFENSFRSFSDSLYSGGTYSYSEKEVASGWNKIYDVYTDIYKFRLHADRNRDKLSDKIKELTEELNKKKVRDLNSYENDLIAALLDGSLAYINSDEPSYSMFSSVKKTRKSFNRLSKNHKKTDSEFGIALTDIALGVYFHDSFWIRSVMGYGGNIFKGLRTLDEIAFSESVTSVESCLFLIEYFSEILGDHRNSLKYSRYLQGEYPDSKYFSYLCAKDLFHTGKIKEAGILFKKINDDISEESYYGFEYESVIYEAKCFYLLGRADKGAEVIKYAESIHSGYMTENFKDEWVFSVRMRQEIIFRPENYADTNTGISIDELERRHAVLFDHGYFRDISKYNIKSEERTPYIALIQLRAAVNISDFKKAGEILNYLENSHSGFIKKHKDRLRIKIIRNIIMNFLEEN